MLILYSIRSAFSSFKSLFKSEPVLDKNGVPNKKIQDKAFQEFLKSTDE